MLYLAGIVNYQNPDHAEHLGAENSISPWASAFAMTGILIFGSGLLFTMSGVAQHGLAFNQLALGTTAAAILLMLIQKRIWLVMRATGQASLAGLASAYYSSTALRLLITGVALWFALPFTASLLSDLGTLIGKLTQDPAQRISYIWLLCAVLFVSGALGGWRGTIYIVALLSGISAILFAFLSVWFAFDTKVLVQETIGTVVPGVLSYSHGIGKAPEGTAIWTAIGGLSGGLTILGLVVSPAMVSLMRTTTVGKKSLVFSHVGMIAGIGTGLLLIGAPLFAMALGSLAPEGDVISADTLRLMMDRLGDQSQFLEAALLMLVLGTSVLVCAFFTQAGAVLVVQDIVKPYILPELTDSGQRLASRIALFAILFVAGSLAGFAPTLVVVLESVTLSASVQFLPAIIGICWFHWFSRGPVLAGLAFGLFFVAVTEPLGIVFFERIAVDIPWGRWPLTIHSAAWGLIVNFVVTAVLSAFLARKRSITNPDKLRAALEVMDPELNNNSSFAAGAWSAPMVWAFFALGPGVMLGNAFFKSPFGIGTSQASILPSLWLWQFVFWIVGVVVCWWLASGLQMSELRSQSTRPVSLEGSTSDALNGPPRWIEATIKRIAPGA